MKDSLGRVSSRDLTRDFFQQSPADPKAWVRARDIPLFGDKAIATLEDLYYEAGWLGWATARGLMPVQRKAADVVLGGDIDWGGWTPGDPRAAKELLGDGRTLGLDQLLEDRKITIKGIEQTRYDQLATILGNGVAAGDSMDTVASNISAYLNTDLAWAEVVARTETRAAVTAASVDFYKGAEVTQVEWLTAWDEACEICQGYQDLGPVDINEGFDGLEGPPGHPNCLCVILPVIPEPEEEPEVEVQAEAEPFDPDAPFLPSDVVLGEKYDSAAGSNREGASGFWRGTDGVERYVKEYRDPEQAWTELLANRLYAAMGADAPVTALSTYVNSDGLMKTLLVTRIVENSGTVGKVGLTKTLAETIVKHFATDLWLANFDAVGTGLDNVVVNARQGITRIDSGGSLLFRAMGSKKAQDFTELFDVKAEPFFTVNKYYAQVLKKAGYRDVDSMDILPDQVKAIRTMVDQAGGTRALVDDLVKQVESSGGPMRFLIDRDMYARLLDERLKSLESKYGTPKPAVTKPVVQPGMSAIDAGQSVSSSDDLPPPIHQGKAKLFGPRAGATWGNKAYAAWHSAVDQVSDWYRAVRSYTGSGYGPMNNKLRDEFRAGGTFVSSESRALMEALEKSSTPDDIIVNRGVTHLSDKAKKEVAALRVGDIMHDYGFQSTAAGPLQRGFAGPMQLRILVPKGTQGAYLGRLSVFQNREKEFLLQAGTSLRVEAIHTVRWSSGEIRRFVVDATVVDQLPGELVSAQYYAGKAVTVWIM